MASRSTSAPRDEGDGQGSEAGTRSHEGREGLFTHADPFEGEETTRDDEPPPQHPSSSHADDGGDAQHTASSSSGHTGDALHHPLDRLTTAATDATHAVADRVKTATHTLHLRADDIRTSRIATFFNPTRVHMQVRFQRNHTSETLPLLWRARDQRKGRNSIAIPLPPSDAESPVLPLRYTPRLRASARAIGGTLARMYTTFPYWDMAFWSGSTYTVGSVLFVVDGVLAWGPVGRAETWSLPDSAETYGGPLCFFVGALLYQVGAVSAYLEAVNDGSFHGAGMRKLLEGHEKDAKHLLDDKVRQFFARLGRHHRLSEEQYEALAKTVDPEAGWKGGGLGGEEGEEGRVECRYTTFRWWPTWKALRDHHVYEIGYLACAIQLFGVTLYGVTAVVVLPGIESSLQPWQKLGAFWVPQIVAALCFLVASLLFMLETQEKWYKPEPTVLGWWIGFTATIGSVGFELIAIFGIIALYWGGHGRSSKEEIHWAEYQSDLATIWGSAAYAVSAWLQWYEACSKNPVEEILSEPGQMKSWMVHPI
ncbi:integral membrane protein [Teratosphaeria destructans]|uniref:Integral membrane protein n=1 Tax=Teratosphaeria destructans TaxID=418781 RepID=A0A9W7SNE4_9PEZI|nr:integral membrane protein [Teratosphaeria destructans]